MSKEDKILAKHSLKFGDDFIADLDSWFSADIACCDNCYDDYLEYWPLAYEADNAEFQRSGIDLDCFYSGSKRLQENYTEEEFAVLKTTINCPRCGSNLQANIWPYELPFTFDLDILDFEMQIEIVTELSKATPFLLLENEFAKTIHNILHDLSGSTDSNNFDLPLYRARVSTQIENLQHSEFNVPPKEKIQEGRYNHAGHQVLYLASDMKTCFHELNQKLCYISKCNIETPLKILDLTKLFESHNKSGDQLNALVFSALMSKQLSTTGWNKPVYVFSRFVSDCAKSAGFDAIKYPSTKQFDGNFNLVIINHEIFCKGITFSEICLFTGEKSFNLGI